jgi:hypothetical protein
MFLLIRYSTFGVVNFLDALTGLGKGIINIL